MSYYIGADLGTSALKLLLADKSGNILKTAVKAYDVDYPHPGWSEQSPEIWWEAFKSGVKELVCDFPEADSVKGIAVAGQMHGLVVLDENDNVIRPAILWNDGRCQKQTDYLNEVIGKEKLSELTANIAFAGFTAPKLLWMKENEPEAFDRISKIMLPKDYINYRLTGVHSTDYSDASGMLLLDVKNRCWSEEMLNICGIDKSLLPKLYESFHLVGNVKNDVAEELNLPSGVKIAAGAGDNAGAAVGTDTIGEGKCNISLGTSGTVFISSNRFSVDKYNALHSFCHADGGFHLMGCMLSAASCNKWFCDNVLEKEDYAALQKQIPDKLIGNNDVCFLPYLMGERSPINDTNATGLFIGLRPDTDKSKMLLAVLEGVSFAIRDSIEVARNLGIDIKASTVCGGGAKSPLWLKILANVLDIELFVPKTEEGPGYGAVKLAAIASKDITCLEESEPLKIKTSVKPQKDIVELYEKRYQKFKKIYPAVKNLYKELKEEP